MNSEVERVLYDNRVLTFTVQAISTSSVFKMCHIVAETPTYFNRWLASVYVD